MEPPLSEQPVESGAEIQKTPSRGPERKDRFRIVKPAEAGPTLARKLTHWREGPDFARVRGMEALAKLPEGERGDWQKLWADVEEMLAKIRQEDSQKSMPAK
jgi:hypothetical protein